MSLGAIDFGLIVDSSVIMIENCVRRLAHEGGTRPKLDIIRDAAIEVRKPTMFGELIIAIVYLPILALAGNGGEAVPPHGLHRDLRPGRFAALVADRDAGAGRDGPELAGPRRRKSGCSAWIKHLYQPALDAFVRHPVAAVVMALALVGASVPVALNLGGEFMPRLNEGDLLIEAVRIPSASLEGAVAASTQVENLLKTIPEVRLVYCKTGRPEIANDVMGVHQTDVWTMLKPQDEWRAGFDPRRVDRRNRQALVRACSGHEVRFQPADRDEGQRAGRRRQERRGRAHLWAGPQGAAPAVAGNRACAGQDPGRP